MLSVYTRWHRRHVLCSLTLGQSLGRLLKFQLPPALALPWFLANTQSIVLIKNMLSKEIKKALGVSLWLSWGVLLKPSPSPHLSIWWTGAILRYLFMCKNQSFRDLPAACLTLLPANVQSSSPHRNSNTEQGVPRSLVFREELQPLAQSLSQLWSCSSVLFKPGEEQQSGRKSWGVTPKGRIQPLPCIFIFSPFYSSKLLQPRGSI